MLQDGAQSASSAMAHYTNMAAWYSFFISHLFRLGSGAEVTTIVPLVPNEPNNNNTIFVKNTVQNLFLAKNDFDTNFDSLGNNINTNRNLQRHTPSRDDLRVRFDLAHYVHNVYTVLHSLVFRGQTGHHDFYQVPAQELQRHLRGRQLQVTSAPAGAHGEPSTQYLNTTFDNFFVMDTKVMLGILIGLSMVLLVGTIYRYSRGSNDYFGIGRLNLNRGANASTSSHQHGDRKWETTTLSPITSQTSYCGK